MRFKARNLKIQKILFKKVKSKKKIKKKQNVEENRHNFRNIKLSVRNKLRNGNKSSWRIVKSKNKTVPSARKSVKK
jgi:hypothetical protein